uniref:Uncharacterized protein n=1 Tax=Phytophthora infestans TaxID=4787 RepID=Q572K2_PHYIN|nr:hypothetical protein PI35.0220c [Phytophthora infestans]
MVFAQLRAYMRNKAPKDFVMHTVLKLIDRAKERRFKSHLVETKQDAATNAEKMKLRALWVDEIPKGAQEKYGGLLSTWDCGKEDHMERLKELIGTWLTDEAIDQNELEARLRQFTFTNDPRAETTTSEEQPTLRSFKEAVAGEE